MSSQLVSLLERAPRSRILVVGDVMLDRYLWGDVERISPEAPIPVLLVDRQEHRLGGAGSVASMLAAFDAEPVLATVTGDDPESGIVRQLLEEMGIENRYVLSDPERPTTVKERLLGRSHQRHPHHMMRVDHENGGPISASLRDQLISGIAGCLDGFDLVVVSDYNKGVCAGEFVPRLVQLARSGGIKVIVDPVRGVDYRRYAGCACITPNRTESGLALGMRIATSQDGLEAARRMLRFGVEAAAVTLDREGIAWADDRGNSRLFVSRPRQVFDVTGAGDMVLSAVSYCLAAGGSYAMAVELANLAGGLEVERLGVVPLSRQELLTELSRDTYAARQKILPLEQLETELERLRRAGRRIVMTNGCFDLLHPGHVVSLDEARRQGDCLVVGLNSDRSVRELKGEGRPIIGQRGRAEMLSALACVDYVVIFDEASVGRLVECLQPDVLVKAADYTIEQIAGREVVESRGGDVVLVPRIPGYSTTELIQRLRSSADDHSEEVRWNASEAGTT